jgi:hypothetical protein
MVIGGEGGGGALQRLHFLTRVLSLGPTKLLLLLLLMLVVVMWLQLLRLMVVLLILLTRLKWRRASSRGRRHYPRHLATAAGGRWRAAGG